MKKTIIEIAVTLVLGTIIVGSLVFMLAMPSILSWVASYLGGFLTYSLFFLAIGAFIYWSVTRHKN
jgi:hypothetical protein